MRIQILFATFAGSMRQITDINELRQIQIGILDHVHQYCEAHGLTYFLSSGSLIGAVRHGGYIPWDDDIDISMPRHDYDIFVREFNNPSSHYRVMSPKTDKEYYYTFAKVVDQRTLMLEDEVVGYEIGVYMDIFPIDYIPDDERKRKRLFRMKNLLYKIRRCKLSRINPYASQLAFYCYRYLPVTVSVLNRWIESLIISKKKTNRVCNMSEAGPRYDRSYPASTIADTVDIEFEGKKYKTMVGYKDYLSISYGDYMTLPPVEQRVTHHYKAFWR